MESRGKLAKRLVELRPAGPVGPGDPVLAGGKSVGSVTSAGVGPKGAAALAYVKSSALDSGVDLTVGETAAAVC